MAQLNVKANDKQIWLEGQGNAGKMTQVAAPGSFDDTIGCIYEALE